MAKNRGLVIGGLIAGVVIAFLFMIGAMLTNPAFVRPAVEKVTCSEGQALTLGTSQYSYKPGQSGVEVKYACCGPQGKCNPVKMSLLLPLYFFLALVPACLLCVLAAVFGGANKKAARIVLWAGVALALLLTVWLALS